MKKYLSFFLLLTITMTSVYAQQKNERNRARVSPKKVNTEDRAKLHTERLANYLELDKKQSAQVQSINEKYLRLIKTVRSEEKATPEEKKARVHDLTMKKNEEIKAVLKKEQVEKFEGRTQHAKPNKNQKERKEYQKNPKQNRPQGHAHGHDKNKKRPEHRGERMTVEQVAARQTTSMTKGLDLNSKQSVAVKNINLKFAKEKEAIRLQKLAPKQKSMALRSLTSKKEVALKKVFSKKQFEKYLDQKETFKRKGMGDRPIPSERGGDSKRPH